MDASEGLAEGGNTSRSAILSDIIAALQRIGNYVSSQDRDVMRRDLENRIREHPGIGLAVGFGLGVLLGRMVRF